MLKKAVAIVPHANVACAVIDDGKEEPSVNT